MARYHALVAQTRPILAEPDSATRRRAEAFLSSPLRRWRPWVAPSGASPQREALNAARTHRVRSFRGGNRSGKTVLGAYETSMRFGGWHPHARHRPPVTIWVSALDWEWGIGQVIWPVLKPMIPWERVRAVKWQQKKEPEIPSSIVGLDGSRIIFKSSEAGARKYQGSKIHFIWLDEEHPADVVEECRARLLDAGGELLVTLTPLRREKWVLDLEREPGTATIRASMRDAAAAGLLDAGAVQRFLASLPERQRRVREGGDFAPLEGLVYPEFDRGVHVLRPVGDKLVNASGETVYPWPLPASWPRMGSIDWGVSMPTAIPLAALDDSGKTAVIERCYYCTNVRPSRWADIALSEFPPLAAPLIADHDRAEREEFRAKGVSTTPARKDVVGGIEAVARFLVRQPGTGRPRLYLVVDDDRPGHPIVGRTDCHWAAWEFEGYSYPKSTTANAGRDLPLKKDDHAMDAIRYLVRQLDHRWGGLSLPGPATSGAGERAVEEVERAMSGSLARARAARLSRLRDGDYEEDRGDEDDGEPPARRRRGLMR